MKIGLVGYGKMGRAVAQVAQSRGYQWVCGTTDVDVCIDFSSPGAVSETVERLAVHPLPWVIGTTGWEKKSILERAARYRIPTLYSANFSLGMALFRQLARFASRLFEQGFTKAGVEIHHREKKDAPSGSALTLMEEIPGLSFTSIREEGVVGIHQILFSSLWEKVEISHHALDRTLFAEGALLAATWLVGKEGIYTFDDFIEERMVCN